MNHPKIIEGISLILDGIGENYSREGLVKTPLRYAKACDKLFGGYSMSPEEALGTVFNENHDEMVVVKDIQMTSFCEHHILPFIGKCHIGYIPDGKIVGLSKMARLVECFARRLQVQERLTSQIADSMYNVLQPKGVGVIIEASHLCMSMRGVEQQNTVTVTTALRGAFREQEVKSEFYEMCKTKGHL